MNFFVDDILENADWTKVFWALPPYKSEEFMEILESKEQTLEHFRTLPIYKFAVERGLIINDIWKGGQNALAF